MNQNFQNPLKILQEKSQEAWSGCIEIEEPKDASLSWHVYFLQGKIQYITSNLGQQIRLNYLWQRFQFTSQCPQLENPDDPEASEYVCLYDELSNKEFSDIDIKKLLFRLAREGLINILSIEKANIKLIPTKRVKKAVTSFGFLQLKAKLEEQIKCCQQARTYVDSPFSRLYLDQKNALKFYKIWKPKFASPELASIAKIHKLSSFVSLFVAKSCLYEIATKANIDAYFFAKLLEHSITEQLITLLPFKELTPEEIKRKHKLEEDTLVTNEVKATSKSTLEVDKSLSLIVCIDDSKTVQKQVRMALEAGGYKVLSITDPTVALKKLSQHQPTVIFMDINMPDINGYDLCSLLRKSQKFKDIPIVMLTGRDGMIDRVRAKIVGATDYLTKPCDPNKLISLTKALSAISS